MAIRYPLSVPASAVPATPGTNPTSFYRIQDPESRLYVRFTCATATHERAPRIVARLTRRDRATRFARHSAAAECFARFLPGATLEIVRCDA